jgi:hypothetical protein
MQKIRISEFFFETRLHWQFKVEKNLHTAILGHVFIYIKNINTQFLLYIWQLGEKIKP